MIAIWRQSQAKVGQLGGPPLKNLGAKNMQNFGYLTHTPTGMGVHQKIFNREN